MATTTEETGRTRKAPRRARMDVPPPLDADRPAGGGFGPRVRRALLIVAVLAVGAAILAAGASTLTSEVARPEQPLVVHRVVRGDLPIVVTERGNLESQSSTDVICEVDDVPGDNIHGTPILWIIPNGSSVAKDELLVELDAAGHRERLDRQIVDTEKARAIQIQARARYENQITQNETTKAEAELKVRLADLNLQMFRDREMGTHRLDVEEIKRKIEEANNEILAARASLALKKNDRDGIDSLFKMGYAGESELKRAELEYLQAESQLAAAVNRLETQGATLKKKESYEHQMELLKLEGAVETANRLLAQVVRDNDALLQQAKAATEAADESLKKEEELLLRYGEYVAKCKITAPQDGMVAYAPPEVSWLPEVRQGAPVRPRQKILTLPDLKRMRVKTAVHESVLDQIKPGLKATIRVDAFADRTYHGTVQTLAVLPDQGDWAGADTKVYSTIVTIDEEVSQLKPGMTAVVDLNVARLENVLTVPVQAVVQLGADTWCYVQDPRGRVERRPLVLGRTNDKFIEIRKGLSEGEMVVLNPMAIAAEPEAAKDDKADKASGEAKEVKPAAPAKPPAEAARPADAKAATEAKPPAETKPPPAAPPRNPG